MRASVLTISLLTVAFAGCISGDEAAPNADDLPAVFDLLAGPALWNDPQNAPHPAYGWPTMSNPPTGDLPPYWAPINATELPASIAGIQHVVKAPQEVASGGGIAMFGSLVYVPGFSDVSYILDVSDPTMPKLLSTLEVGQERGAALIAHPDGRLTAVVSTGPGFNVHDITDPMNPVTNIAQIEPTAGGHKLGVVPGTPIVYNANSNGGGLNADQGTGITEIYDLTDPANPVHVQDFANGFGCHHIYFWNNAAENKSRTICAGIEFAQIWDTADPLNPTVIVSVPIPHGVTALPSPSVFPVVTPFAHFSILSLDGKTLIVGDELGGGGIPPGCVAGTGSTGLGSMTPADPSVPAGALWFYDVSTETEPQLLGWFSPGHHIATNTGQPIASCTAHHGRLVPTEGRDLLAMSFYGAGVVLLDFSNPTVPNIVDQWNDGAHTWETWYNNGYLFTGDLSRGLDVLAFE